MPKITITKPFNYRKGLDVEHYAVGKKDVAQDVAEHAYANGFAEQPPKPTKAEAAAAEQSQPNKAAAAASKAS